MLEATGPTWESVAIIGGTIITILLSVVISMVAAYSKSLDRRLTTLEGLHKSLNDRVLSQYHDKTETNTLLGEVKNRVEALHTRFDMLLNQHTDKG
jgi:Tfp pilus assembly protein PilO